MTLHTSDGCTINNSGFSGSLSTSNCYVNAAGQSSNAGCGINSASSSSYGSGFNSAGGGVYAMEWTSSYIQTFFFPPGSIPADITSGSPNPSGWGTPAALFEGNCNIDSHFNAQQIVSLFIVLLLCSLLTSDSHKGLRYHFLWWLGRQCVELQWLRWQSKHL